MSQATVWSVKLCYNPKWKCEATAKPGWQECGVIIGPKFFELGTRGQRWVVAHETGHTFEEQITNMERELAVGLTAALLGRMKERGNHVYFEGVYDESNPSEAFATCVAELYFGPTAFKKRYPKVYEHVKNMLPGNWKEAVRANIAQIPNVKKEHDKHLQEADMEKSAAKLAASQIVSVSPEPPTREDMRWSVNYVIMPPGGNKTETAKKLFFTEIEAEKWIAAHSEKQPARKPAPTPQASRMPSRTPMTQKAIKSAMRAAGEKMFRTTGSCGNFEDWEAGGTKEFKYPHEIKIGDTTYRWHVSDSHRKGRHLTTSRELWVVGGNIPPRTKFSVGSTLTRAHLNRIVKIIHDDQVRRSASARKPTAQKPTPALPPALTAPPELAADVLGARMGLTPTAAPKRKPTARKPKTKPAATPKTTKKPAKPKAKKTATTPKLTAAQREYLAIQGFVMVKRGGKFIKITN